MHCPFCNHPKIITDYRAPIGGSYIDEEGVTRPRLRCAGCGKTIVMSEINPYRAPKGRRKMKP